MEKFKFIYYIVFLAATTIAILAMLSHKRYVGRQFANVLRELLQSGQASFFDEHLLESLPEPAQRYLTHVLTPGVRLAPAVKLRVRGRRPFGINDLVSGFHGNLLLIPGSGYELSAKLEGFQGLASREYDYFVNCTGESRLYTWGYLINPPVRTDFSTLRKRGLLAGDMLFVPASFLLDQTIRFEERSRDIFAVKGDMCQVAYCFIIQVDPSGAPIQLRMQRWDTVSCTWIDQESGIDVEGELLVDGIRIPRRAYYGWFLGNKRMRGVDMEIEILRAKWL